MIRIHICQAIWFGEVRCDFGCCLVGSDSYGACQSFGPVQLGLDSLGKFDWPPEFSAAFAYIHEGLVYAHLFKLSANFLSSSITS